MIQIIDGAPEGVLAFKAVGEVGAKDYEDVLKPAFERALAGGRRIRLVLEIGPEYGGSSGGVALGDLGVVLPHLSKCERCAVVTDRDAVSVGVVVSVGLSLRVSVRDAVPVAVLDGDRDGVALSVTVTE